MSDESSDNLPIEAETVSFEVQVAPGNESARIQSIESALRVHPYVKGVERDR